MATWHILSKGHYMLNTIEGFDAEVFIRRIRKREALGNTYIGANPWGWHSSIRRAGFDAEGVIVQWESTLSECKEGTEEWLSEQAIRLREERRASVSASSDSRKNISTSEFVDESRNGVPHEGSEDNA